MSVDRRVLLVDDDRALLDTLARFFTSRGWSVAHAGDARAAVAAFERDRPDVTVLDLQLPGLSGMDLLELLRSRDPDATVLLLTGHGDIETAVEAMRLGAENFLTKPMELSHLEAAAERAYEKAALKRTNRYYTEREAGEKVPPLGSSPAMRALGEHLALLADNDATVLLLGETGTGKGHAARLIHSLSRRAHKPFVEVNCGGLTATFLDSELFGHERGAFTDAKQQKPGLLEIANGGTLFLDEVGELAPEIQPKLLNVLEARRFRRMGGTREIEVDVRLIAATNRDLREHIAAGRFREDLYYRIAVLPLTMPPLRERGREGIVELATRILAELRGRLRRGPSALSTEALQALAAYSWPGNVRELRNVLERVLLLAGPADVIRPEHLPPEISAHTARVESVDPTLTLAEVERRHILGVLRTQQGNVTETARVLQLSRSALYDKLRRYGAEVGSPSRS